MGSPLAPPDPPIDRVTEDPTDPTTFGEEPTPQTGFRDEPTAAAGTRTVKWQAAPPWLDAPDPLPREPRHDPYFWPVVVFVTVLIACVGITLVSPTARHRAPTQGSSFE